MINEFPMELPVPVFVEEFADIPEERLSGLMACPDPEEPEERPVDEVREGEDEEEDEGPEMGTCFSLEAMAWRR